MEERARKLGGSFRIQTSAGIGTEVTVRVSFDAMQQPALLAALNAAPTAGRIIARIGPVLGMTSASTTGALGLEFDGTLAAKYEAQ